MSLGKLSLCLNANFSFEAIYSSEHVSV
jgi:hypothetical protein